MTDDAFAEALGQQDAAIASMLDGDPGPAGSSPATPTRNSPGQRLVLSSR
jgi:hypothetical protein